MIKLIGNADNTIALCEVENTNEYTKIIRLGYPVLKDLVKMMAAYDTEQGYELGTVETKGGKALVFLPIQEPMKAVGFVMAGLYDPEEDKAQTKIVKGEEATS